jgi:hypothetical protein
MRVEDQWFCLYDLGIAGQKTSRWAGNRVRSVDPTSKMKYLDDNNHERVLVAPHIVLACLIELGLQKNTAIHRLIFTCGTVGVLQSGLTPFMRETAGACTSDHAPTQRDSDKPQVAPEDTRDEDLPEPAAEPRDPGFFHFSIRDTNIYIRKADYWVNASHILNAAKLDRWNLKWAKTSYQFETVRGHWEFQGTYIPPLAALELCQTYGLQDFIGPLQEVTLTTNHQLPQAAPQLLAHFGGCDGQKTVCVRNDGYVNLDHILQVGGVKNFMAQRKGLRYETVLGHPNVRGRYIERSKAIEICNEYELSSVAAALRGCSGICPAERPFSTKEFVPHSPDGNSTRQMLTRNQI